MSDPRLLRVAWATLVVNVGVILFGAVVRATGSGDGCGANWPTCGESLIPDGGSAATVIEFIHRTTSAVALVLVLTLAVMVWRRHAPGTSERRWALAASAFIVIEALIGAVLVLARWVAEDDSVGRAISVPLHLVNTFLLLAALAGLVWVGMGRRLPPARAITAQRGIIVAASGLLLVAATGALTALGDTLFPADDLLSGLAADFDREASAWVRWRWVHPVVAVITAVIVGSVASRATARPEGSRWAVPVIVLVAIQVALGFVNVILLAPLWMQIVHLFTADALWVAFVLFALEEATQAVEVAA